METASDPASISEGYRYYNVTIEVSSRQLFSGHHLLRLPHDRHVGLPLAK